MERLQPLVKDSVNVPCPLSSLNISNISFCELLLYLGGHTDPGNTRKSGSIQFFVKKNLFMFKEKKIPSRGVH